VTVRGLNPAVRVVPVVLASLLAVPVLAPSALARPVAPADPKVRVLQLRDMPSGFTRKGGRYVSNASAGRENDCGPATNAREVGRINGYDATFQRGSGFAVVSVASSASVHRTVPYARKAFLAHERALSLCPRRFNVRRTALRERIGDEARLWMLRVTQSGVTAESAVLTWRSGTTLASVSAGGLVGTVDPLLVVRLAKAQQARIARAK
jgi:hypothetical protein